MLLILLVLSCLFAGVALSAADERGSTFYVHPTEGGDTNDGTSPQRSFATLGRALQDLQPGDTLLVAPGVYLEQLRFDRTGAPGRPILIRATDPRPGRTVLSAADPAVRRGEVEWRLDDQELGLYSIPFAHNPARVLYSGTDLQPYPTLASLGAFLSPDGYPGAEHGFHYDDAGRRLFVRLHAEKYGSREPARHTISVSPPNAGGSFAHHVWRPEHAVLHLGGRGESHIVLDGLTFETPGAAGVITFGDGLVVRNCTFKGCRFGVYGMRAHRVFIENCRYDQADVFADMIEVLDRWRDDEAVRERQRFFWWGRKQTYNYADGTVKVANYETGIAGGIRSDWHIRDNLIEEAFEGLSSWCLGSETENLHVYGNHFQRLIDNAVETENHARNVRIFNNRIEDVFEPFSWQPLGGLPWAGPVFVYRNLVTTSPRLDGLWPGFVPGCFKLGASNRNWEHAHMGGRDGGQPDARISKRFAMVDYPGFLAFNNTVLQPYGKLLTTPMPGNRELVNFRFFNNILAVSGENGFHHRTEWDGSLIEFYANLFIDGGAPGDPRRERVAGTGGLALATIDEAGLRDAAGGDFRLQPDSPGVGRGIASMGEVDADRDLGAFPSAAAWRSAAGPGQGIPEEQLSPFQRAARYRAEFVRTAGPEPGLWGLYADLGRYGLDHPAEANFGTVEVAVQGTAVRIDFRALAPGRLLEIPGVAILALARKNGALALEWTWEGGGGTTAHVPAAPAAAWRSLAFHLASGAELSPRLDGIPLAIQGVVTVPPGLEPTGQAVVAIAANPVVEVVFQ